MLNVKYQEQQDPRWCGPAAIAMVLTYYGLTIQQQDIASEVMQGDLSFANDLGRYVTRYGFEVLRIYGLDDNLAISKLCELLDDGIPPIVLQHPVPGNIDGHFRIVIDVKPKAVVVHDPFYGSHRRYRKPEFLALWKRGGPIEDNNTILVIRQPQNDSRIESCPYCDYVPQNQNFACNDCHQSFQFPKGFPTECLLCHSQWTEIKCGRCNRPWNYFKPHRR